MSPIHDEPRQLLVAAILMVGTAIVQTFGVVFLEESINRIRLKVGAAMTRWRMLTILCGIMVYLFALHLVQMSVWAAVYLVVAKHPTFSQALYQSALSFTTMDEAELPNNWLFLAAAEGVTGLLMFAWSTGARRGYLHKHGGIGIRPDKPEAKSVN